ncbi:MAG: rhodanese-like domain-containing protein [Candidatus Hodarchaeales archaeon]
MFSALFLFLLNPNIVYKREFTSLQASIQENYKNISVTEAINLIENTTTLFILDVRTEDEYNTGHINNSVLIPYNDIESRQDELPHNKSRPILVYCRLGGRSVTASNTLITLNYTCVYNMLGGYTAWLEAITSLTSEPVTTDHVTTETFTSLDSNTTKDSKPATTSTETSESTSVTSTSNLTTGWPVLLFLPLLVFCVIQRRARNYPRFYIHERN